MTSTVKPTIASLAAEAFNVYTETGLTPRQLADQRAELLRLLKICRADMALFPASHDYDYSHFPAIDAIIAECKGGES